MEVKKHTTEGVLSYDIDNAYPNRVDLLCNSSGRASSCIGMHAQFISGAGFVNEALGNMVVNRKGETLHEILVRKSEDEARFVKGWALHFNYNALGQITEINHVPYKECRFECDRDLKITGRIAHYYDWFRETRPQIDRDRIKHYDPFNPDPNVVLAQATAAGGFSKWNGQILYSTVGYGKYSLATFDPVLEDVMSDVESKFSRLGNLTTNFMASHVLKTGPMKDEERDDTATQLKSFQGGRDMSKIMHVELERADQMWNLEKVEIQDVDGLFRFTDTNVKDGIRGIYLIPPVLVGDLVAGKMGTAQEIQDATAFYNGITENKRKANQQTFEKIMQKWHEPLPATDFSIKPVSFFKTATTPA